jgi:hypothetical protein
VSARGFIRTHLGESRGTDHDAKGDEMYIGGGVLVLILIVLLLIWLL